MNRVVLVCLITITGLAGDRVHATTPAIQANPLTRTQIVLLGTGTPNADPDRSGPAVAIVVDGTSYLVDCGPGVVRRAAAAFRAGVKGLDAPNLKRVFITHLHSDHTVGLPDLIFTPWVLGRNVPLEVYGPPGVTAMTDHLLKAYQQDIDIRINGLEPANTEGYKVNAHEITPGIVYRDERVTVRAFPVKHGSWPQAFGYRFETPDRTIVISGDAVPSPGLIEQAKGCDVLIHEVYSQAGFQTRPPEWQRYHANFHTSSAELAAIAAQTRPGLLILYHQLIWSSTEEELLKEIRQGYDGKVVSGHDLEVY
ncbi:MAG: MBL fold metallo-hydrolase [Candidatus Latescibacteria bacterium]|nr:MBL fold metallo-hydrolase [Candidatus Latescibacterota bacterium]